MDRANKSYRPNSLEMEQLINMSKNLQLILQLLFYFFIFKHLEKLYLRSHFKWMEL